MIFTACEEDPLQNTVIDYTAPELEVSDASGVGMFLTGTNDDGPKGVIKSSTNGTKRINRGYASSNAGADGIVFFKKD